MRKLSIRQARVRVVSAATLALVLFAGAATGRSIAAPIDTPSPPPASDTKSAPKKDGKQSQSGVQDPAFLAGYRTAYAEIFEQQDYGAAITRLKALGRDDVADVANLIGYSYRKLKDYDASQVWYERALKADPRHVRTWQYYGLWQVEQDNRQQAEYHLSKIRQIAGTDCVEYRSLAAALAASADGSSSSPY